MNIKESFMKISSAVVKGVYFIIPFAVAGGILISLSYIIDLVFSQGSVFGLGSENPAAVILKSLGTLSFSFMLPVLASAIAVEISDKRAFAAGLVGGYLAQNGATLMLPFGDTTSVSGFIGAIAAGIIAGYIFKTLSGLFSKAKEPIIHTAKTLVFPLGSILLTGLIILSLNL